MSHSGDLSYFCFRASCEVSGKSGSRIRGETLQRLFGTSTERGQIVLKGGIRAFEVPEWFVEVSGRPEILEYLYKNNCLEAYQEKRVDIKYDPRQNRVVFMIKKGEEYVGATGRTLDRSSGPRWFIFGDGGYPFFVGRSNRGDVVVGELSSCNSAVLVEDCASACAVSRVMDSFALLGTNLAGIDFKALAAYQHVYVALDKDASLKAIKLHRQLSWFIDNPKLVFLDKDLKYCNKEEIERILLQNGKQTTKVFDEQGILVKE